LKRHTILKRFTLRDTPLETHTKETHTKGTDIVKKTYTTKESDTQRDTHH
jgi:hypothetical protein